MNKKPRQPWPAYDPGDFRHIVQIQRQVDAVDALGQPKQTWPTVLTCKAAIDYDSNFTDREFFQAGGLISARTMPTITIRWTKLVKVAEGMRAYFVDQRYSPPSIHTYQINFVENVQNRDVLLKLNCSEINAKT